jgi:hypothetical protein
MEVVQLLMDEWPEALQTRRDSGFVPRMTEDGFLPLHCAAANDAPLEVIYHLLKACPLVLG